MNKYEELSPGWLYFLKGLVDSENRPLYLCGEILQPNRIVQLTKTDLIKRALELFLEMSETKNDFKIFSTQFGWNIVVPMKMQAIDPHSRRYCDSV
jgi:molecular chaperone HtpG